MIDERMQDQAALHVLGALTPEEASVFADPSALVDPRHPTPDSTTPDSTTPPQDHDPSAPRW